MQAKTLAVSITLPNGRALVKRVRASMLHHYTGAGWHVVPRRRFKAAKRATERMALR